MKKAEFKSLLVAELTAKGIAIDDKKIASALAKTARSMVAKHGGIDWQSEFEEARVYNAVYFYKESDKNTVKTFNRIIYQNSRRTH